MARIRREPIRWPAWRYGPSGEKEVFNSESEVPFGWTNQPGQVYTPPEPTPLNKEDLITQLMDLGVKISPIWGTAHLKRILDDGSSAR